MSYPFFDCKIFDGAAVVHSLSSKTTNTFTDYADQVFVPFLLQQLEDACRVDLVWDCRYIKFKHMHAIRIDALLPIDDRVISIVSERRGSRYPHHASCERLVGEGFQEIMICTVHVDTDVVVILIGKLHNIVDN